MLDPTAAAQQRLQALFGLKPEAAERAVQEVLDTFSASVDEFIVARHSELHAQGLTNDDVIRRIAEELPHLRFKAKELTPRQIRRRIYG